MIRVLLRAKPGGISAHVRTPTPKYITLDVPLETTGGELLTMAKQRYQMSDSPQCVFGLYWPATSTSMKSRNGTLDSEGRSLSDFCEPGGCITQIVVI